MTEIVINNVSLDIYKDIPISLNYSIADIRNPEKRNTSFSKTITIPGSKKNNLLFNHIFEVSKESNSSDIINFSPDFNPRIKAICKVYADTLLQMDGYCQLLKIIKSANYFEYEICIFGVLGDFFVNIDSKSLTDLDFSEYSHQLVQKHIERSWDTKIQKNGADYINFENTYQYEFTGQSYSSNSVRLSVNVAPSIVTGISVIVNGIDLIVLSKGYVAPSTNLVVTFISPTGIAIGDNITLSFGNILTSIPIGEGYLYPTINYGYGTSMYQYDALTMYPSLYLKSYIDKIFKLAGFTYSGSFKITELFKRLTIPASSNVDRVSAALSNQNTVIQSYTVDTLLVDVYKPNTYGESYLKFPNTIQDIADLFNTTNGITTIKKAGKYEIVIDYTIQAVGEVLDYPPNAYNVQLPAYANIRVSSFGANGSNVFNNIPITNIDGTFSGQIKISGLTFIQGGTIRIQVNGCAHLTVKSGTKLTIKPIGVPLAIGDIMNPNATIPSNVLLKDFFLSIVKMFNLYIRPDENNNKNLIIESANQFYNNNKVLEWSDKVDRSSPIEVFPVSEIEGKDYVFTYKDDSDYYNVLYKDTYKETYGNRSVSIINDFAKGKKEIGVIFSPTISVDTPLNKMVVPHIVTKEITGVFSPFDSNIRILYYGGLKNCFGSFKIKYDTNITYTKYPYVGHVDDPLSPTLDLLFEIPKVVYWNTSIYTTANLYNVNYRKFIEEITDKNSKVIRIKARLRSSDINGLNFKNFIQIDNINYRLNRILDYSPIDPLTCIVELSKIKNGVDYSAYQINLNPTIPQNLIQGGLNEVRSTFATSYIQLIQGGLNQVQAAFSDSPIKIINGGTD